MTYDGVWHLRYIMGVHFFLVWHRVHWLRREDAFSTLILLLQYYKGRSTPWLCA